MILAINNYALHLLGGLKCLNVIIAIILIFITIFIELTAQKGKGDEKKDQQPRSNSGPMLYCGVSATQTTETA